jgi:hypothetical protein
MRRTLVSTLVAAALLALPATALAAPKDGCAAAASGWHAMSVEQAAEDFFPHLLPGQFATAEEFAEVLDMIYDRNGDDMACIKLMWGWELNPNSHWYRAGFELGLDEPVHVLLIIDNTANAT